MPHKKFSYDWIRENEEDFKSEIRIAIESFQEIQINALVRSKINFLSQKEAKVEDKDGLRSLLIDVGESIHIPLKWKFDLNIKLV